MRPVTITAVSYLNTLPFIYGILNAGLLKDFILNKEVPAACVTSLITGKADIGLVPVAALPSLVNHRIVTDYCIGALGPVRSVLLLSQKPLKQITKLAFDPESKTSIALAQVLIKHYWEISPKFYHIGKSKELTGFESIVAIGDKTFDLVKSYTYCYDLSEEWWKFTKLAFVFACWVARRSVSEQTIMALNNSLKYGLENMEAALNSSPTPLDSISALEYLKKNISYHFDDSKKKSLDVFLDYLKNNELNGE